MDKEEINCSRRELYRQRMAQEMPDQREKRHTKRRERDRARRAHTSTTAAMKR